MGMVGTVYALFTADTTSFTRKMQALGASAGALGRSLTLKLTAPLLLIAGAAVKVSADFEQKLTNAFSVTGSASEKVKGQMEDLARAMGKDTVFSAGEAADAMYYMASAGWKAEQMTVALEDTLNLAAATNEDLAFTTNTVVSALNMFSKEASEAGAVADVYANAISNSQATLNKLGTSMSYVGPIANSLGYSIEDTTAALMGLYNKGIDASMAGTGLRMSLMKLLKPSGSARKALKEMGLTLEDLSPQTNTLVEIVRKLEDANMDAKQAVEIFGARASAAMINLVSTGGDALDGLKDKLGESGTSARMAAQQIDTLKGQWKLLTSALSEVAIQFGKILLPILKNLINNHLKPFVKWIGNMSEGTKKIVVLVGAFAAALGPLCLGISKLAITLGVAAGPLGLLITALALIATKIPGIVSRFKNLTKSVYDFEKETENAIVPLRMFWKAIKNSKEESREFANAIQRNHGDVTKVMEKLANGTLKHAGHLRTAYNVVKGTALKAKEAAEAAAKAEGKLNQITEATKKGQTALRFSYTLLSKGVDAYADNLIEVAKIKGDLTKKRAAEIQKIRGETTTQDLLYKAYNNIITALKTRTNLTPKLISQLEGRKTALEALIGVEKTHLEQTKELIPKIKDERTEVEKLNAKYWDLMADVFKGEAGWQTLLEQAGQIKEKLAALTEGVKDLDMALDDDAEKWIDLGDKANTVLEDMGYGIGSIPDDVDDATEEATSAWNSFADGLRTKWASAISDVILKAKTFSEALKGIGDAMLRQFIDMLSVMVMKAETSAVAMKASFVAFAVYVSTNLLDRLLKAFGIIKDEIEEIVGGLDTISKSQLTGPSKEKREENKEKFKGLSDFELAMVNLRKIMGNIKDITNLTTDEQKGLNEKWAEAIKYAKEYGQEGTKAFVDQIKKMREMGLESKALTEYIWGQLSAIPDALNTLISNIPDYGELKEKIARKKLKLEDLLDPAAIEQLESEIKSLQANLTATMDKYAKNVDKLTTRIQDRIAKKRLRLEHLVDPTAIAQVEAEILALEQELADGLAKLQSKMEKKTAWLMKTIAAKRLKLKDLIDPEAIAQLEAEIEDLETQLARGMEWAAKQLDRAAVITKASWQAMIAEGKGYLEVLNAMKEPLETLRSRYEALGKDAPEFLKPMFDMLEKMELSPKVFENLDASRTILTSLANSAYLTQDAFDALAKSAAAFARTMFDVTGNLNDFMKTAEMTDSQVQQLLPVVSQFVGAAAAFGLGIPAWMKSFVETQLGLDFKEFKKTAAAQANAGLETVKKLDRVDQRIKRQTEVIQNKFNKLGETLYKHLSTVMGRVTGRLDKINDSISNIGGYASGGVAWNPQLAMLAEHGPEVIMSKREFDQRTAEPSEMNMMIEIQPVVIPTNEGHIIKFLQKSIKRGNFNIPINAVGD